MTDSYKFFDGPIMTRQEFEREIEESRESREQAIRDSLSELVELAATGILGFQDSPEELENFKSKFVDILMSICYTNL